MFEQKRRRAAKLTNFFGVSHRDIMDDILESIESGVEEDAGSGTLNQAQADVRPSGFPLFFRGEMVADFFGCTGPFRICSGKCGTSKPGLDDPHSTLCIPFNLPMYYQYISP